MKTGNVAALHALLEPIRADLEEVEAELCRMMSASSLPLKALLDHVSLFAGKRLRPALTLLAGRLFGRVRPEHYRVGAIIELIHTATLIHDDILDESSMRRRMETVNRLVGNETAVLLGDYLFATGFKEAALFDDPFAARYLSGVVAVVCRGEILQVHHRHDFAMSEEVYLRIINEKTAALYAAALRCGAHFGDATREQSLALEGFGTRVGKAFQIIDDILDLTGEEATVGKSLGTDLEKAKMTLPLMRLRDVAGERDARRLQEVLHSGSADARPELLPLLEKYGAIESARATARELLAEAHDLLGTLPDVPERGHLHQVTDYVFSRDL